MSELFLAVLNMSLTASYVILFVVLIRLLLKKAPKFISYALWSVVAFRLIIPFSFESMFSLIPRNTYNVSIPHHIIHQQNSQISSGIEIADSFVSESLPMPILDYNVNSFHIYVQLGAYIWILGIMLLLIYGLISFLIIKKQLKSAQLIEKNIFKAKSLKTPFVLGLIRPKIYLPFELNVSERSNILLHEQSHIKRKDHLIKVLAFLILSIHWFNPLVWIAFILMSTDMELSCDERVLKEMNEDIKKSYANSLLTLAIEGHILNGSPLAFGEGNVKERIKNVLNYKKPRFWVVAFSMIIAAVIGICLIVNPVNAKKLAGDSDIYATSEKWAEAFKNRDEKARYELMTPESKTDYYHSLVYMNSEEYPWVIGGSSPYVVSYEIKTSGTSAVITYITETSESKEYIYQEQLFFYNQGEKTFVSNYSVTVSYLRKDLYEDAKEIQKQIENGHQAWRLNPESIVLEFVHRDLGVEDGKIIASSNNDVVFKKDDSEEIKIKLYRPINIHNGFFAIYEYSIGTNHYILDNNYIAPRGNVAEIKSLVGYLVIKDHNIYFDEVDIVKIEDKKRVAELGLNDMDMPNGYAIINENQQETIYELADKVDYIFTDVSLNFIKESESDRIYHSTKKDEFLEHLGEFNLNDIPLSEQKIPYFIEVQDGKVISITEKFEFTI